MTNRYRGQHKTVSVKWDGVEARVDRSIAPLIKEIWKAGIFTLNSCQENRPGIIWIAFFSVLDAEAFLNIVARYEEGIDTLYNRIRQAWTHYHGGIPGAWEYDVLPTDFSVDQHFLEDGSIDETCTGPSEFIFTMSVRFPKRDYPILLKRMKEYNATVSKCTKSDAA